MVNQNGDIQPGAGAGKPVAVGPPQTDDGTGARPVDLLQLVFWSCLLVSAAAAAVAIAWPRAVGTSGPVLLIAMGATGMVFLLWVLRGAGRRLGLFPERDSAAQAVLPNGPRYAWIDALDEAVLVSDRAGAPIAGNTAYRDLTIMALPGETLGEDGPLSVDQVFGASPGVSAPVFRLSRAARTGETRREILPPVALGVQSIPAQYEVAVSPLPRGRVLWRLRRIAGNQDATGATDLRSLYIEDAPTGFFAVRPDGTISYANLWLRERLGLPETLEHVRLDDIMRPEFVKRLSRERTSSAASTAHILLRGRDGVEIPVQAITSWAGKGVQAHGRILVLPAPEPATRGEAAGLAAETASRPAGEVDPMFGDAPFGAVRLTGESIESAIIVDANRALMELTGGRAVPGTRFADLFVADGGNAELADALTDAIDKLVGLELAGEETHSVSLFVSLDAQGRPTVAYIIDMTEQKALEMRLAQAEKMQAIGQLAGGVAHDFNNVLTGIMLNNDTLMTRHPVGDPSYGNLKNIHEFSVRARDLVRMLLAYARQQTFKSDVMNITDFLSEFSMLLRQIIDERVEVDIKHGRDVPHIRADMNQLETAIINLATNARDAMLAKANGGKLTIRTSRATAEDAHKDGFGFVEAGEYLLIEVIDNGNGIPPQDMDKIFQPFFTTKGVGVGTGLGLSTVYGIIKQSGGYVCPVSQVGEGTTFKIYLPALAADQIPSEPPEEVREGATGGRPVDMSGRGRILFVEDEAGVRSIAAQLLENRGYEVEQAGDGEEALDILKADPGAFDLIISDVVMPGMDGPTLIREAAEYLGDARIVFISGYAERDIARQLDENREVSFLAKPFQVAKLAERVKQELARRAELSDKLVA